MRLYNTLTRTVEPFDAEGEVHVYVCGVTPYDTTHLGHGRTYVVFDVLIRHLRLSGYPVRYVQNVTDIDDSILKRARETGEDWKTLGERYAAIYFDDTRALGIVEADAYPRATEVIAEMQDVIGRLIGSGHAYTRDGDVFFRVSSFPDHGKLCGLDRNRMLEIEASQDDPTVDDPRKEDPLDFPLWRAARPGEPSWDSPWGLGRPGWHIECSTLAATHLGPRIDIHGGGTDLVFPHHEAEIAQAEAATGRKPFSRFWVHTEMVRLDGKKMSKSDGNMVFVRDLLTEYSADALRLYMLAGHYRELFDHDPDALASSADLAARLAKAAGGAEAGEPGEAGAEVTRALDDDLDTPRAIQALERMAQEVEAGRLPASALVAAGSALGLTFPDSGKIEP